MAKQKDNNSMCYISYLWISLPTYISFFKVTELWVNIILLVPCLLVYTHDVQLLRNSGERLTPSLNYNVDRWLLWEIIIKKKKLLAFQDSLRVNSVFISAKYYLFFVYPLRRTNKGLKGIVKWTASFLSCLYFLEGLLLTTFVQKHPF